MKDLIIGELVAGWTENNPHIVTVGRLKRKLTSGGYRIVDNPVIFSKCCKFKDFDFENMKPKQAMSKGIKNAEKEFLEVGEVGYSDTLCNRVECVEDYGNSSCCELCCFKGDICMSKTNTCTFINRPDKKNVHFKVSLK